MENQTPKPSKWYDNKVVVTLLCIFFFPVGLYALWMNGSISKGWKIGYTIFIALIVIAASGDKKKHGTETAQAASTETHTEPVNEPQAILYSADQITDYYHANEVRGDNKFKGKTVYIKGRISEIKKDFMDNIIVTLKAGGEYSFNNIHCTMTDANVAANLEQDEVVTVKGKCDGLMMGSVILKDCSIQ